MPRRRYALKIFELSAFLMYLSFEFNDQYFSLVKLKEEARVSGDDSRDCVRTLHCLPTMQGGMVFIPLQPDDPLYVPRSLA